MVKQAKKTNPWVKMIYFITLFGVISYGIKQYMVDHTSEHVVVTPTEQELFRGLESRLNEPADEELQQAKDAYLEAFALYTRLATGEESGDMMQAREAYRRTYYHYKELLDQNTSGVNTGSPASETQYAGASGVFNSAQEALQSFYDRQAARDVNGMLQVLASGRWSKTEAAIAQENFQKLVQAVTIQNPKLEIIAAGTDRSGKNQLVQYIYDFELTYQGVHSYQTGGNVACLVKVDGGWQLLGFIPDPDLSMEVITRGYRVDAGPFTMFQQIQDRRLGMTGQIILPRGLLWTTALSGAFYQNQSPLNNQSPIIELNALKKAILQIRNQNKTNQYLYDHLGEVYFDELDGVKDIFATVAGIKLDKLPVVYTVHERLKTLYRDLPGDIDRQDARAIILDLTLVAWGGVQIYCEKYPGAGFITDVVEGFLEQLRYNHVQRQYFAKLWLFINTEDTRKVPKYAMIIPDPTYEEGVDLSSRKAPGSIPNSRLIESVDILSDRFVKNGIPLKLAYGMELEIKKSENEIFFEAAKKLKASIKTTYEMLWLEMDDIIYIPIKIHNLSAVHSKPALAGLGSTTGYTFLDKSQIVSGDEVWIYPSCHPGNELITLTLSNGQEAFPLDIHNTVLNALDGVLFLQSDEVVLSKEEVKMAKVYGSVESYYIRQVTPPDLSGLPCLEMHVQSSLDHPNPSGRIAVKAELFGVYPQAQLRLTGLEAGEAWIQFDLMAPNPRTKQIERTGKGGILKVIINEEEEILAGKPRCTYLNDQTAEILKGQGWSDVYGGLWQLKAEKKTGMRGYYKSDEQGRPVDIGLEESIWGEAYIEFAYPGVDRQSFSNWIRSNKKTPPDLPVRTKEAFRTTTLADFPCEIFEEFFAYPSYKYIDTLFNINGQIEKLDNHWVASHTERSMVFGVEGEPGAQLAVLMVSIATGTNNPSGLGQNKESSFFEEFFNRIMATVHDLDFYVRECSDLSF